jgi:choline dehydrogenase-like flavoprotein
MADRDLAHVASEPVAGWSPSTLRSLVAVFETIAPDGPDAALRRAHLAAETLNAVADPDELRLLRLAINALSWPPAVMALGGGWSRFEALDLAGRERVLLALAGHRVSRLRTAFQAMKRLGLFLAYADPGDAGAGNPSWPRIGYERPAPAVDPPAPSIRTMDADRTAADPLELETDVVIVGSGAGGGVVAARLAAGGRDVIVVEAGPYLDEESMPTLEAQAMQRLYLDQGTSATSDLGVTILAGACLGGGTTINWTTSLAPPDWLRDEWEHEHGLEGFGGAETDADIARLRAELDLRPPTVIPPKDQAILDGAAALGWEAAPTERNAGPCTDCGACGFGCRFGYKRSGLRAHLAAAARDGARFLDRPVEQVQTRNGRAEGVTGALANEAGIGSRPFSIRARAVVVAAGALRTPLVLHASGITHPQLGRNLHLHPVAAIGARMPHPVEMWCGPTQAARSLEFAQPWPRGGFVIESAPPHPGLVASAFPWEGRAKADELMREVRDIAPLIGIVRDRDGGHVHWTRHRRARIDYRISPRDAQTGRRALVELARLARAAGALELIAIGQPALRHELNGDDRAWSRYLARLAEADFAPNRMSLFSAHQMGTARAGGDPTAYPCDPDGRVRTNERGDLVAGLHVADASLFPSAAGVNPMLTVMTLAERTARALLAQA